MHATWAFTTIVHSTKCMKWIQYLTAQGMTDAFEAILLPLIGPAKLLHQGPIGVVCMRGHPKSRAVRHLLQKLYGRFLVKQGLRERRHHPLSRM